MTREELAERLRIIAVEMDTMMRDIGPKWIKLGHLSKEAKSIIAELEVNEQKQQ